jgi:hypothetical protein
MPLGVAAFCCVGLGALRQDCLILERMVFVAIYWPAVVPLAVGVTRNFAKGLDTYDQVWLQ